jgi:hypothetical protein
MARKNWDKIATKEFEELDEQAQKDWADLRVRISGRTSWWRSNA